MWQFFPRKHEKSIGSFWKRFPKKKHQFLLVTFCSAELPSFLEVLPGPAKVASDQEERLHESKAPGKGWQSWWSERTSLGSGGNTSLQPCELKPSHSLSVPLAWQLATFQTVFSSISLDPSVITVFGLAHILFKNKQKQMEKNLWVSN